MAMDFPSSPSVNQVFGAYTWDGEKWKQTAAFPPEPPSGRLTLTAATPIMTAAVAAGTTVYWTPYLGAQVPFYDGTNWTAQTLAETSVATTNTTKNPAAIGASKVNDWFLWNDAGTVRLSHGPDWTNDTTRSAGTALVMLSGILMNNAAITNGPAASRGTYVGTTRSEADLSIAWSRGSAATGGGMAKLNVWNMYNRVAVAANVVDSTATWTCNVSSARSANSSTSNRVGFVSGLAEDNVQATIRGTVIGIAANTNGAIGMALDSTTAFDVQTYVLTGSATGTSDLTMTTNTAYVPQLGYHYIQALEIGDSKGMTFAGGTKQGLLASLRM
jgi:hypothetical protein